MPLVAFPDGSSRHVATVDEAYELLRKRPDAVLLMNVWRPYHEGSKHRARLAPEKEKRAANIVDELTDEKRAEVVADVRTMGYEQAGRRHRMSKSTILKIMRAAGAVKRGRRHTNDAE